MRIPIDLTHSTGSISLAYTSVLLALREQIVTYIWTTKTQQSETWTNKVIEPVIVDDDGDDRS